jgi:hypothetical protein
VLLIPLLLAACGVSVESAAAPAAAVARSLVDSSQLQQWSTWSMTSAARRRHCQESAEFGSGLWFLAAPSGQATANWTCSLPAGSALLVVAASMAGLTLPMCSRDYSEQVGVDGSAALDGTPVALRWLGPVDGVNDPGPRMAPERTCALTGFTAPMATGHHLLVVQYILGGQIGTTTVDIDAY